MFFCKIRSLAILKALMNRKYTVYLDVKIGDN